MKINNEQRNPKRNLEGQQNYLQAMKCIRNDIIDSSRNKFFPGAVTRGNGFSKTFLPSWDTASYGGNTWIDSMVCWYTWRKSRRYQWRFLWCITVNRTVKNNGNINFKTLQQLNVLILCFFHLRVNLLRVFNDYSFIGTDFSVGLLYCIVYRLNCICIKL